MKKLLFFCISIAISVSTYSQDLIIKKTSDEIKAKIIEVGINEIKYKRFDFQDGPTYSILKSDVLLIRYENGINEVINSTSNSTSAQPQTSTPVVVAPSTPAAPAEVVSEVITYNLGSYTQNGRYISKTRVVSNLKKTNDAGILALLKKSNNARLTGNILATALGIPLMVAGTITTLVGGVMVYQGYNPDAGGVATFGGVMAASGIMLQFTNIGHQSKSKKHLAKAIDIYNAQYADKGTTK